MTIGGDLVPYAGGQPDGYRPQIMTPEAARALDEQVRMCTRAVLREGTDYGIIPGTSGDKVLFRPGAQKLLQWFGLGFTCERVEVEHDAEGRKHGITYRAMVARRLPDGTLDIKATCEGTADYDEDKFYQSAATVQAKAEAKERMWAAKDRRVANPTKWKTLGEYRAPWNSLMKRAQKRAIVGAVIDATAAGGLFKADDDSEAAPADGGPSWYQQALGEAAAIATEEEGRRLHAATAQAKLAGQLTADQATHVQNRIRSRVQHLRTVVSVDVEDLAEAVRTHGLRPETPQNVPPAQPATPPAPSASPVAAASAGGTPGERSFAETVALIISHFKRLGWGDSDEDRQGAYNATARLCGLAAIANFKELTPAQADKVARLLEGFADGDAQGVLDLINDGVVPDGQ